jgi:hypothetical protein
MPFNQIGGLARPHLPDAGKFRDSGANRRPLLGSKSWTRLDAPRGALQRCTRYLGRKRAYNPVSWTMIDGACTLPGHRGLASNEVLISHAVCAEGGGAVWPDRISWS